MKAGNEKLTQAVLTKRGKILIEKKDGSYAAAEKGKTDWKRLRAMRDEDIDFSDIPELDRNFWKNATPVMPESKDRLTIRLDRDLVRWLKRQGRGYQTRINAILRAYMRASYPEASRDLRN